MKPKSKPPKCLLTTSLSRMYRSGSWEQAWLSPGLTPMQLFFIVWSFGWMLVCWALMQIQEHSRTTIAWLWSASFSWCSLRFICSDFFQLVGSIPKGLNNIGLDSKSHATEAPKGRGFPVKTHGSTSSGLSSYADTISCAKSLYSGKSQDSDATVSF